MRNTCDSVKAKDMAVSERATEREEAGYFTGSAFKRSKQGRK